MNEAINIVLNGKNIQGIKNETVLQLAERNGVAIPTLCHDPRLEPFTSCFICVVEIAGMRGLQPSCSTRITEGMMIETDNEKIHKARKTALDLLLSNHYADCLGPCKQTCPAGVDVQGYISMIEKGLYSEAVAIIKETNPLPAICGRVCVRPCEVACRRNLLNEGAAVGIDYLKRFAADRDLASARPYQPAVKASSGKKIAIIGAGPAGLSAAFFLQKEGHQCDIYEASPAGGGWLRYGIPEYRLPNNVLQKEIDAIMALGVNIYYQQQLGGNLSYGDLQHRYDATVLAIGCQAGTRVGCEGDDAENVLPGIEFLKTMELTGRRYDFRGKTVAVVGGGNTAMDCCRSAIRCGAKKVVVVYRRTEAEMPANPIEIHESKLEGVEYLFLTAPVKINKDENGKLRSMTCIRMELGEPDASGRRRPVPVEGSETELEFDVILAAIGQKTVAGFLDDINRNLSEGEVRTNKWGDLEARPDTLQTTVPSIFAAGDGVTGAATLIQAIAQARIAALSCHQYLTGQDIVPRPTEFISKKENFKVQLPEDYANRYVQQKRHEMPTMDPAARLNFNEVELGYENEQTALEESHRCLECGCTAYFECDLKKYATQYKAEQTKFSGTYNEFRTDFRHPFIEIDNNKCILCARCVRICKEVVGAGALGLVNRGFKTYVAPAMGASLQETNCESCGMCISACPTGAITENVDFKPGPVKTETFETLCHYCSVGCTLTVHHRKGYILNVTGGQGLINRTGNLCRFGKFGHEVWRDRSRITTPLLKENGSFRAISFAQAFEIIAAKIRSVQADENAFFAGARLSNEEQYLVQKLGRYGAKTNNVSTFHYVGRGRGYRYISRDNMPFPQMGDCSRIFLFGTEMNYENGVASFAINNAHHLKGIPLELITTNAANRSAHQCDNTTLIADYYAFIKAANHYLLSSGQQNQLFIGDRCAGFEVFRNEVLAQDFNGLAQKAGVSADVIIAFADAFNREPNAVLVFSEKNVNSNTALEIRNLCLITGKLGKTAMGMIALKEKNNAQGLYDMGICGKIGPGTIPISNEDLQARMRTIWNTDTLSTIPGSTWELMTEGKLRNLFIFGEDPLGCAIDRDKVAGWLNTGGFLMVQDFFMTDTAAMADLILPSSWLFETGGTYTNTQRHIQQGQAVPEMNNPLEMSSLEQLSGILQHFGAPAMTTAESVAAEMIRFLIPAEPAPYAFEFTAGDSRSRFFNFGCDSLVKRFENHFSKKMS